MFRVVLDTNVLVSALWKKPSNSTRILDLMVLGQLTPFYNGHIIYEYKEVLNRPKFRFSPVDIENLLDIIRKDGMSVLALRSGLDFIDEDDRMFYEVAQTAKAFLITGNVRHYPTEPHIISPTAFLEIYIPSLSVY